jgi:hypothetical protein
VGRIRWSAIVVLLSIIVASAAFLTILYTTTTTAPKHQRVNYHVVVLGLKPNLDGSLQPPLQARLVAAQQVYRDLHHHHPKQQPQESRRRRRPSANNDDENNVVVKIVMTGADTAQLGFTEAHAMAQAIMMMEEINRSGTTADTIPESDIWLEEKAVDTIENAIYSLDLILERSQTSLTTPTAESSSRLILVTSEFHMPRSWFIFDCVVRHYRTMKGLDVTWETTVASPNHWSVAVDNNRTLYDRLVFERYLLPKMIPMLENDHGIPTNAASFQKALRELQVMIAQHEKTK